MSTMLSLHARSTLAELATLARWFRCYDLRERPDQPRFKDVFEVNESRARREAALKLGCSELHIRVEPGTAELKTLEVC